MHAVESVLLRLLSRPLLLAACATALVACGPKATSNSQVVAKVNGEEITQTQLNQVLKNAHAPSAGETHQAVDSLVNEALLVQQALSNKLDRDPEILQTLQSARRQILSKAYLERYVLPKDALPEKDIEAYYNANSILFAHRRIFGFTLYHVAQKDLGDAVRKSLAGAHSPQQLAGVLNAAGIPYTVESANIAAESLPLARLDEFGKAAVNDVLVQPQADGTALLMLVTNIREEPRSLEMAETQIRTYLTNRHDRQAIDDYLKQARAAATVKYTVAFQDQSPAVNPPPTDAPYDVTKRIAGDLK